MKTKPVKFGRRKDGQPYPKLKKKAIKGLVKENTANLKSKFITKTKDIKVIKGQRNALFKDKKGNLLVLDPTDNRLGVVSLRGEFLPKEGVIKFIRENEKKLKGIVTITNGKISVVRTLTNIGDATATKVIHEEHKLLAKKIPESQIHLILEDRHGKTAKEIIDKEHQLLAKGIPEGKVHVILRKTFG
jgi:hypothetical protein